MSMQAHREMRQTGLFGKTMRLLFFAFNVLMAIWLVSYWATISGNDAVTSAERAGSAIGGAIGTVLLLFIWLAGAGILGALTLATRGPKIVVPLEANAPPPSRRKGPFVGAAAFIGAFIVVLAVLGKSDKPPTNSSATTSSTTASIRDSTSSTTSANRSDPATVPVVSFSWRKDGLGSIMMATFHIRNTNSFPVKDIEVKCIHSAESGTAIDSNTRTIYRVVAAGSEIVANDVNMGFMHSDTVSSRCSTMRFTPL
jgi:hypothetical protein